MWASTLRAVGDSLELNHEGPLVPAPRASIASVHFEDNSTAASIGAYNSHTAQRGWNLLVFGGIGLGKYFNDVHCLNFRHQQWQAWCCVGHVPSPRGAASAALARGAQWREATNLGTVFVFGGRDDTQVFNDLFALDLTTRSWNVAFPSGALPPARDDAMLAATDADDASHCELVLYGGTDLHRRPLSDMWVYNQRQKVWRNVRPVGDVPPWGLAAAGWSRLSGRGGNSALVVIYGGFDAHSYRGDVYVLDLGSFHFARVCLAQGSAAPRPRTHPCIAAMSGDRIVLVGGYAGSAALGDAWLLDLTHLNSDRDLALRDDLSSSDDGGVPPTHRSRVPTEFSRSYRDTMTMSWCAWRPIATSVVPPRGAAVAAPDVDEGIVLVFGGCTGSRFVSSTSALRVLPDLHQSSSPSQRRLLSAREGNGNGISAATAHVSGLSTDFGASPSDHVFASSGREIEELDHALHRLRSQVFGKSPRRGEGSSAIKATSRDSEQRNASTVAVDLVDQLRRENALLREKLSAAGLL